MNIEQRVTKLVSVGWEIDAARFDTIPQRFEILVHEIAHNLLLGNMTPKDMAETDNLISDCSVEKSDADEIMASAITIQVLETLYDVKTETNDSLFSVNGNVKQRKYFQTAVASDEVIELVGTPRVISYAKRIYDYIESVQ